MNKIVLLGDSTLDNKLYTGGEPSVAEYLDELAGPEWTVELLARDGHRIRDVYTQLEQLPEDAACLLVSVGGNDAWEHSYILENDAGRYHDLLTELHRIYTGFVDAYGKLAAAVKRRGLPLILTTIYEGDFGEAEMQKKANTALAGFNDAVIRTALRENVPVIELREACSEPVHFTQIIEPSAEGGKRFAEMIQYVLETHDFENGGTRIYGWMKNI